MADAARCIAFMRAFAERRAGRIVPFRYGRAYFDDELPLVWYLNELVVDLGAAPSADELAAEADRVQAALRHRKLCVDDEALGERLAPELHAHGWNVERQAELREQRIRLHARRPDQGCRGDPLAVREEGRTFLNRLERRRDADVEAALLELPCGVVTEPRRDLRENLRRGVDEDPAAPGVA